ncbi:MAG: hypothetical protein DI535_19380 [Citrobacter freundii]|nr:MAG: hypothetical protein DI535_19380 [Citrobacter freundii]
MRATLLLALLCFGQIAFSQSSSIKGSARDTLEKKNLSNAVISLLRPADSVLVKFARSNASGDFKIGDLDGGEYIMLITYPKFADYSDKIKLPAGQELNLGQIPLTPKSQLLSEVIVRANNTIRVKGDTTEFNADSFKVREGATVEDLLKVIPGMSVNSKGEVTAQGKRVDKVLVDGEEFFGADPTIATQNIGAKAVDKVQVYDTKSEQDQLKGIGSTGDGNKTINIKLKESAKKGYFGRLEGSTDFDKLHNGKVMFNKFKGNQKISVYGTKSNINTGNLGWEDRNKMGIEDDYEYDEISGYYYSYRDGDGDFNDWSLRGLPNAYTAGALYGDKWKEDKNKLNLSYLYNRLGTTNNSRSLSQTLLEDTTFYNNSSSRTVGLSQRHSANLKYEWKIDSLASIKFTAAGTYNLKSQSTQSYSESLDEDSVFVNTNTRDNTGKSTKKQLDNVLTYKQLFKKKNRQLMTTLRLGLIEDESDNLLISTTNFYKNGIVDSIDHIDQQKINTGNSTTYGAKVTYNEPISDEWNIVAEYSLNKNASTSHRNSYDKGVDGKYDDYNQTFSNNFDLDAISNSGNLVFRYQGKKLRMAAGSGLSAIRLNMKNLDRNTKTTYNFTGFTPTVQFGYNLKTQTRINFSYRGNTVQPTLSQLQPLPNNSDPLNIYVGNPDLKVGFNHNLNLNYNDYKVLSGRYTYLGLGMSFNDNAITNFSTVDSLGKRTYMPVNVDGGYNYWLYGGWNSGQGQKKLNHELSPEINGGKNVNYINGQRNVNTYSTISFTYGLSYNVQDKYSIRVGPRITRDLSKSSLRPTANNNYWSYGGRADGYIKLPLNLELQSDADFNLRQKTPAFPNAVNIIVWNAQLNKKFLKDKSLKIGVIAHDILNQNIGFDRTINSNFISEQRYDRLARYFLFSVSWTFNKMPGVTNNN